VGIRDETGRTGTGRTGAGRTGAGRTGAGRTGAGGDGAGRGSGPRGRWLTGLGAVGIGYSLSWIAGLSVSAPSPAFGASGRQIVAAFAGHGAALATQFALTEGLPAAGIAVVTVALANAARTRGQVTAGQITAGQITAGRLALASGLTAAIISVLQFVLGLLLATTSSPGTAHLAYAAVNRMDGGKMLALAVLGAAGAAMTPLPRWLRITGIALAVSITVSGVVYLLLLSSLAAAAGPALVLLLIFITGCGIIIGMQNGAASPRDS
jgi:hypothetical protein